MISRLPDTPDKDNNNTPSPESGQKKKVTLEFHLSEGLQDSLTGYADSLGIRICLENLAWGWSSRPELFEKMLRKSELWATLDIGHARISPSIVSQQYEIEDFCAPHGSRFLGAHIYHTEANDRHYPPESLADLRERLDLLRHLSNCRWWVLELREQEPLLQTLTIVRDYLDTMEIAE